MSVENNDKKTWYDKLSDRFQALMNKFDMPEDMRLEIENFVVTVAKEQYVNGNKNGISWLRKQVGAKPGQLLMAVDAPAQAA